MTNPARQACSKVVDVWITLLADEGYRPKVEDPDPSDGLSMVPFKSEGKRYVLFVEEGDPDYFHLGTGFTLGDVGLAVALQLANEVNARWKGVKATIEEEDRLVHFHVECFLCGQSPSVALVERSISALRAAADDFFRQRHPPARLDA